MTTIEIKKFVDKAKKYTAKVTESKEASKKTLIDSGIYTEKGNLKKPYNGKM